MELYYILHFIGRLVFGAYFIYNGVKHLKDSDALSGYAASQNVPNSKMVVQATGLLIIVGGAGVILGGFFQQIGSVLIAVFLVGVTYKMHAFWKITDPGQKALEEIAFWKNTALLGAALYMY